MASKIERKEQEYRRFIEAYFCGTVKAFIQVPLHWPFRWLGNERRKKEGVEGGGEGGGWSLLFNIVPRIRSSNGLEGVIYNPMS